ncbi:hypothetical protein ACIB24_08005 [Spongisporangium articulatum]|uniref:Uncharacterized protein n=1 Tax=Spongisporangium articulatum TaxID=3362603 RepID=A0ABW8AM25_9ACTN
MDQDLPDDRPGTADVTLTAHQRLRLARAPGATLDVQVLGGSLSEPAVVDGRVHLGAGRPWRVQAGADGAVLRVRAIPPGPERVLEALVRRPEPDLQSLVSLGADHGVELLPD